MILFPLIVDRFGGTFYLGGLLAATKKYTKGLLPFYFWNAQDLKINLVV